VAARGAPVERVWDAVVAAPVPGAP
jgi:hypothetical protein